MTTNARVDLGRSHSVLRQTCLRAYRSSQPCAIAPPGEDDNELPRGTDGEIVVRPLKPDIMFQGYWRRPEDTLKIMRNMWLHTGDIGKFDEDGFFWFSGRDNDMFKVKGQSIWPSELESMIFSHPEVDEFQLSAYERRAFPGLESHGRSIIAPAQANGSSRDCRSRASYGKQVQGRQDCNAGRKQHGDCLHQGRPQLRPSSRRDSLLSGC